MTKDYADIYYDSADGLRLYARDYGKPSPDADVMLCMHGLTRNSADFHDLAMRYKDRYHIISVDQRGRGLSAYDPNKSNYGPAVYCGDMFTLIAKLDLKNIIAVGTSMGGIMAMLMAKARPGMFKAAVLNDIGPEIAAKGLERIRGYVGGGGPFKTWADAAQAVKAQGPDIFPDYTDTDWMAFAKRIFRETREGEIAFAYDLAISEAVKNQDPKAVPPDLWAEFKALIGTPVLVIRGALSDLLAPEIAAQMCQTHPDCTLADIPRVGHAPMLSEPESFSAIDNFLEGLT